MSAMPLESFKLFKLLISLPQHLLDKSSCKFFYISVFSLFQVFNIDFITRDLTSCSFKHSWWRHKLRHA